MTLETALEADAGVTCVVGAGGKKSTVYELAGRLERTVLTATVRIPIFDRHVADVVVTSDPDGTLEAVENWPLGLVADRERDDRYVGYEPDVVDRIARNDAVDHVLVKADGARTRLLKAPSDHEPQLPESADTVLAIASVHAVGQPLTEAAVHRPERVSAITGRAIGEPIRPTDVATVLTSLEGGRKDVPEGATYVPVLNMVDDETDRAVAEEIAALVLERSNSTAGNGNSSANRTSGSTGQLSKVVLTSMIDEEPLVSVVSI